MIARELLVKLGFDIDEKKLNRFSNNIDNIKSQMSNVKSNLNIQIDSNKISNVSSNIKNINAEMSKLKNSIREKLHPKINNRDLEAYKKELSTLSKAQRDDILRLNALEKANLKDRLQDDKVRYAQLQSVQKKLAETQRQFKAAATAAKSANLTFSRYFTRFAVIGAGSFFMSLRKTIKEVKDVQNGKANNLFSREQLNIATRFNNSIDRTKATLNALRNEFVINLMPALQDYSDKMNNYLLQNREFISSKIKNFIEILGSAFKNLTTIISTLFSILNPLVNLIGGWSTLLTGFVGLGIMSWVMRLGIFLKRGAAAVLFFSSSIRALTIALMTNPIALVLTTIASVIALIADEFIVTARGGDSLMNRFAGLKKIGDQFIETLKNIWAWLVKVKDNMYDFSFGGGAKDMFKNIVDDAGKAAKKVSDRFSNIFSGNTVSFADLDSKSQARPFETINRFNNAAWVPQKLSKQDHSTTKNIKVTNHNKQPININITTPQGGSDLQNKNMANLMKDEIRKALDLQNVELSAAIGAV